VALRSTTTRNDAQGDRRRRSTSPNRGVSQIHTRARENPPHAARPDSVNERARPHRPPSPDRRDDRPPDAAARGVAAFGSDRARWTRRRTEEVRRAFLLRSIRAHRPDAPLLANSDWLRAFRARSVGRVGGAGLGARDDPGSCTSRPRWSRRWAPADQALTKLWNHSMGVRRGRPRPGGSGSTTASSAKAYGAGLLHDIGAVLLRQQEPGRFEAAQALATTQGQSLEESERASTAPTIRRWVDGWPSAWGLPGKSWRRSPATIVPGRANRAPELTALVHIADSLADRAGYAWRLQRRPDPPTSSAWEAIEPDPERRRRRSSRFDRDRRPRNGAGVPTLRRVPRRPGGRAMAVAATNLISVSRRRDSRSLRTGPGHGALRRHSFRRGGPRHGGPHPRPRACAPPLSRLHADWRKERPTGKTGNVPRRGEGSRSAARPRFRRRGREGLAPRDDCRQRRGTGQAIRLPPAPAGNGNRPGGRP